MMKLKVCGLVLMTTAVFSQSPPASFATSGLTDYPVIRFFLKHVAQMHDRAMTTSGGMTSVSQEWVNFETASGLTEKELAVLVLQAEDCEKDLNDFDTAAQNWRKQYPPGPLPVQAAQKQAALGAQRQQIVTGYMNALKSFYGAKWSQVYNFAWNTEAPHIQVKKPSSASSANPTPLSQQQKGGK